MAGRQRTTFDKLQRERARLEKQAAKRARRQGGGNSNDFGPRPQGTLDESPYPPAPAAETDEPDGSPASVTDGSPAEGA